MRLTKGKLQILKDRTGLKANYLSDLASGRKRPGGKQAARLAAASGVDEIIWLYGSADEIKAAIEKNVT